MCCSCERDQMMMLLCQSTVCLPHNPTARDTRQSRQAELLPFCKHRSSLVVLDKNTKMNMTKSQVLQNYRGAAFAEGGQVLHRQM